MIDLNYDFTNLLMLYDLELDILFKFLLYFDEFVVNLLVYCLMSFVNLIEFFWMCKISIMNVGMMLVVMGFLVRGTYCGLMR